MIEIVPHPLPHPGGVEISALLDSILAEYNWPTNPKNAARAGWTAAMRYLAASVASPAAPASPVVPDESVTCERCGEVPETHTANHWCDNQSFAASVASPAAPASPVVPVAGLAKAITMAVAALNHAYIRASAAEDRVMYRSAGLLLDMSAAPASPGR